MPRVWPVMTAVSACAAACGPAAAPPLEPADFVLSGVPRDADSAEIRMSFGEPDSVVLSRNPYEAATPLEAWYYEGLIVRYTGAAVPSSYVVTGGDEATARGIRVHDPADLVVQRYGEPVYRYDTIWTYVDPDVAAEPWVLEFLVVDGVVTRIHLGRGDD